MSDQRTSLQEAVDRLVKAKGEHEIAKSKQDGAARESGRAMSELNEAQKGLDHAIAKLREEHPRVSPNTWCGSRIGTRRTPSGKPRRISAKALDRMVWTVRADLPTWKRLSRMKIPFY